ncbi:Calcineurin-like phosphoesterase domain, ApaH type [uncultured Caudovirales phage]|uniref:Calcineurin-like phosphoesterase domain, ApaH type n=1 Tax=uncultured Caudovirales phage TaxID=2100421 RepID=A0A6J5P9X8_9CAUD|nr:Calcineurin-like phosphoesterase domain, ApaH type [uncultured Caudovirales phage]
MKAKVTDEQFIEVWNKHHSPSKVAHELGISVSNIHARRSRLVAKGHKLITFDPLQRKTPFSPDDAPAVHFEKRRQLEVKNGHVIIFSDPHFYPDHNTVAQDALIKLIKELKPKAVLCGGDALDGTQIGRHDPTRGWHQPVSLEEQLACVCESMTAIKKAAKGAITYMTLGNHDARLSRYLAVNAPHMEGLPGTRLEDYIPSWPLSWTLEINGNTIVRHRHLGGMLHMQAQKAGCHYVHGHLHKLGCMAMPQYHDFKFSIDCGSLSDPSSDAFDYTEDGVPHVQGFAILTYKDGKLLWPEFCYVMGGKAFFRGALV